MITYGYIPTGKKTDTLSRIPVLPTALSIIHAYEGQPQCVVKDTLLPVLSNQIMNIVDLQR